MLWQQLRDETSERQGRSRDERRSNKPGHRGREDAEGIGGRHDREASIYTFRNALLQTFALLGSAEIPGLLSLVRRFGHDPAQVGRLHPEDRSGVVQAGRGSMNHAVPNVEGLQSGGRVSRRASSSV
jgi:hypothetical protein